MDRLTFDKLLPKVQEYGKLRLLVKGEQGITVTLYLRDDEQVAICSIFMMFLMKWEVKDGCLIIKADMDAIEVNLLIECQDLVELV